MNLRHYTEVSEKKRDVKKARAPEPRPRAQSAGFSFNLPAVGVRAGTSAKAAEVAEYQKRDVKKARAPEPRPASAGFSFNLAAVGDTDKPSEYQKRDVKKARAPEPRAVAETSGSSGVGLTLPSAHEPTAAENGISERNPERTVGRCRLTPGTPRFSQLTPRLLSALETKS